MELVEAVDTGEELLVALLMGLLVVVVGDLDTLEVVQAMFRP